MTCNNELDLLRQCRPIKVHKTSESGFLLAFEFLDGKCISETRKRLHLIETKLRQCFQDLNPSYNNFNLKEKQFIAIFVKDWKRYCRGYIFHISPDCKKYQVYLIDYGLFSEVECRSLKPLPDFASLEKLKPLAMKIALYGILPVYMELSLKEKPKTKASKRWNAKCMKFIEGIVSSSHIVYFKEMVTVDKFQFGIIYFRKLETGPLENLQDLLVQEGHAVEYSNFDNVLPSIVKRLIRSVDNVQLPVCEEELHSPKITSPVHEISDNESCISVEDQNVPDVIEISDSESSSEGQKSETSFFSGNSEVNSSPEKKRQVRFSPSLIQSDLPNRPKGRAKLVEKMLSSHSKHSTSNVLRQNNSFENATESLNEHSSEKLVPCSFSTPDSSSSPSTSTIQVEKLSPITPIAKECVSSEPRILKSRGRGQIIGQIGSFSHSESFNDERSNSNSPSSNSVNLSPKVVNFFQTFQSNTSRLRSPVLNSFIPSDVQEQLKFEKDLINKIMIVGDDEFKPVHFLRELDLHPEIKERLAQLHITDLNTCQKFMIPAVMTRKNVTLIDGPKCGKTLSCMIALMSMLKDQKFYEELPIGTSPKAIVICPYSSRCEWICQQCDELSKRQYNSEVSGEKLKINTAYGCGTELEREKMLDLTKSYDIVICTPRCLLRLLETKAAFNLARLCHIVFDETHTLLNLFHKEVVEIMKMTIANTKKLPNGLLLPQRIVISNSWFPTVKVPVEDEINLGSAFLKATIKEDIKGGLGIALFSSYLEAALFSKIKASLKFLDCEKKKNCDVLDYINNDGAQKSIVIVFEDVEKMNAMRHILLTSRNVHVFSKNDTKSREEILSWKLQVQVQQYPILLCTDFALANLLIYEADCLIHYDLPETKSIFSYRFSVLLNQLKAPKEYSGSNEVLQNTSKAETLIYLHRKNSEQFPIIVNLMERLNASIPSEIKNISNKLKFAKEQQKRGRQFCENLKKFGKCLNESLCEFRHTFLYDYDSPDSDLPTNGIVKVHVLRVYSANHFCVRLLELSDSGKWDKIKTISHPCIVQHKINRYFSNPLNAKFHICESVGEVAALEVGTKTFKRVKIIKFNDDDKKYADVKFMEDGKLDTIRTSVLLTLPKELAEIPASTVDVYLCNLRPIDEDEEWGTLISNNVQRKILASQENEKTVFVGKIQLVSGRSIWLHPFECKQWFESIKSYENVYAVYKYLISHGMAIVNDNHLSKLKQMYTLAGLTIPAETSINETSININQLHTVPTSSSVSKVSDKSPKSNSEEFAVVPISSPVSSAILEKNTAAEEDEVPYITPLEPAKNLGNESAYQSSILSSDLTTLSRSSLSLEVDSSDERESVHNDAPPSNAVAKLPENSLEYDSDNSFDVDFNSEELQFLVDKFMPGVFSYPPEPAVQTVIKPTIYWKQNLSHVFITINVNCDDYSLRLTVTNIYFRAKVDHDKVYEFDEPLHASIDVNKSTHYKSGVQICVKMEKLSKRNKWTRLIKSRESQPWIKISPDCVDDEDIKEQNEYWPEQLCTPPALETTDIIIDLKKTRTILPDGYEDYMNYDSDADSECYGGDRVDDD